MDTIKLPAGSTLDIQYDGDVTTSISVSCEDAGEISDGYHTFNSLYRQRMILSASLANITVSAWKSKLHHDGEVPFGGGWFIMGWTTPAGSYTYHYQLEYWDLFKCRELERAPEWDGHTDEDVDRLLSLCDTFYKTPRKVVRAENETKV